VAIEVEHYLHENISEINFAMTTVGNQTGTSSKGKHLQSASR
jgi:hypothetical protein